MKPSPALLRHAAAVLTAALVLTGTASAAPKKPEPAPAAQPAPAPEKKGMFTKAKEMLGLKKKEQPAPKAKPVAESKPAAKPATKPAAVAKAKPVPPATPAKAAKKEAPPAVAEVKPEKKGWIRGLFSKSKSDTPAEPKLAKAKTAKPAPVKDLKPAKSDGKLAKAGDAPQEKGGIRGFFRRLREPIEDESTASVAAEADKIERPADWEDHKIVAADGLALYTFGPSQFNGPDQRLNTGAVVKVKKISRGYALVEANGGTVGYVDASMLRSAAKTDFREPPPAMASATASVHPDFWAPLAPPPDLPDQPSAMDAEAALLLLPPLELEPKPNP